MRNKGAIDREALRESLWPESREVVWPCVGEKGWAKIPRVLPIIFSLINTKALRGDKDIAATYLALLCLNREEGILDVRSEAELAEVAGFSSNSRGVRMWRERVRILCDLGLLRVFPRAKQEIGFVMLLHPYSALEALRKAGRLADDGWWNLYQSKLREVGASPAASEKPSAAPTTELRVIEGQAGGRRGRSAK
jgi:hypothetical protein